MSSIGMKREDDDCRRLQPDRERDGIQRRGEAAGRSGGGDTDHDTGHQPEGSAFEALVPLGVVQDLGGRDRR